MDGTIGANYRLTSCSCHQEWERSFALEVDQSGMPQRPGPTAKRVPGLGPHSSSTHLKVKQQKMQETEV